MEMMLAVRSEWIKVKGTPFGRFHLLIPLLGAAVFVLYFVIYSNVACMQRMRLILELTAMVFPLLISIIVGMSVSLEEKASHFQALLAVPNRSRAFLAKLIIVYGAGCIALTGLFVLFLGGAEAVKEIQQMEAGVLLAAAGGIALANFIIYVFHLFLNLRFGIGISLFWGVFESLQCIMYSNLELQGAARYIPFSWSIIWIQDVLKGDLAQHSSQWLWIMVWTALALIGTVIWFCHWEGRKQD